ncbi:MAG: hypothetical protein KatS3mg131_2907 [Candidatus Tectimicrobiota bacterium]|nr:MAG: hypothetical protein KatS3mg131_2907 [Candidatus Tectomicrobia bacterium]
MREAGVLESLPKKEALRLQKKMAKLEKLLGGIKDMEALPDALFVIDCKKERIAVSEARKLGIPLVAMVDTNCDPEEVDYPIPCNDDSIRAIGLITSRIADAALAGLQEREALLGTAVALPAAEGVAGTLEAEAAAAAEAPSATAVASLEEDEEDVLPLEDEDDEA